MVRILGQVGKFVKFCNNYYSIKCYISTPFHPATNGIDKNVLKSFKSNILKALKSLKYNENKNVTSNMLIYRHLFMYRKHHVVLQIKNLQSLMMGIQQNTSFDFIKSPRKQYKTG